MSFEKPKMKPKCGRCDLGELAGEVWSLPVCHACHGAWMADEQFSSGTINAALDLPDDPRLITDFEAHHRAYCAEATRRTRAWAAAKARAA